MRKRIEERKAHLCVEGDRFEVLISAYPHAIFRCKDCLSPMRSVALDDLEEDRMEFALEMIQRYRDFHGRD